jgi:phosphopantothenoylcysteine decarboxylase / phosphopantothenate---cysteine ligase
MPLEAAAVPAELRGRRVAVLVAGGIAAYKVADLVSQLVQGGCEVRVAMTPAAARFVGPTTFQALSGRQVLTSLWGEGPPEPHVELGDWAQVALVAPATANTLAKVAGGHADDPVGATALAARCPVVVAPAMNDAMWAKPAVQDNLAALRRRGCRVVEPESGRLASGHAGAGRLAGAAALLAAVAAAVESTRKELEGRRVVVTAGGTREPIDPVRFIGNYSSGKMGFAVAAAAAERGAEVVLVSTAGDPDQPRVRVRRVETAAEMLDAVREEMAGADLLVMAAAVADFRPARRASEKIRREEHGELVLHLERNVDVLAELPAGEAFRLGFAAEGSDLEAPAREKLERKSLDAILANDVTRTDIAFGADYNAGVLLFRDGTRVDIDRVTKRQMADRILDAVVPRLGSRATAARQT